LIPISLFHQPNITLSPGAPTPNAYLTSIFDRRGCGGLGWLLWAVGAFGPLGALPPSGSDCPLMVSAIAAQMLLKCSS
jgi:hypothetical protein